MKQDTGLHNIEAVNSLVKAYSDCLPSGAVKIAEAGDGVCIPREPEIPPSPVPNISFKAYHTLQKLIDNISENIALAYEISARTRNRQAQMILRDFIKTADGDLTILRGIYRSAVGVSPAINPYVVTGSFYGATALRAMFANEMQILEDLQSLKEDYSMQPYIGRLNYVTSGEIDEMRLIGLLGGI